MNNLLLFFQSPWSAGGPLNNLFQQFALAFPRFVAALSILIIGWLLARLVRKFLRRILEGLGTDRMAERLNDIDIMQTSGMKLRPSVMISQAVYYFMLLIFVIAATELLGAPAITQLESDALNYLPALFTAVLVLVLGIFVADLIRGLVLLACQSLGVPSAKLIATAVFYFLLVTVAVSALSQAKINTDFISANLTVLIAAAALAFAVGYGLASRDLVANYLASHYNRNKVRVGDDVSIEGARGKVVLIDSTSLILQTSDRAIVIPLSKLTTQKVEIYYPDAQDENLLHPGV